MSDPAFVADGDFSDLYARHAGDVHRFALWLSGNTALADDLMAETFTRAWIARDRIRVGSVKAYLFMIARNLYLDVTRRHAAESLEPSIDVPDDAATPETTVDARRELRVVLAALHALPELDRAVLLMATIGELPYEAIAAAVDLSVPAIRVRVHRARVKLNQARSQWRQDP